MSSREGEAAARAWSIVAGSLAREDCRSCECLHGTLVELRLALEELPSDPAPQALLAAVRGVERPAAMHGCLGCVPCGPGDALVEFYRATATGQSAPSAAGEAPACRCGEGCCSG